MKRKFLMLLMSMCFIACSVDPDGMDLNEGPLNEFNAVVDVEGCDSEIYDFGGSGNLEVVNDNDFLYVTFVAKNGYSLTKASLHIAGSLSEFPTVGQGNLPAGQLEYQETFNENQHQYTFPFALDQIEDCVFIAAYGSFSNGTEAGSYWAGDIWVEKGNWSYIEYCKQTCENPCEGLAGPDNSVTLTISKIDSDYNSVSSIRDLYGRLLGDGVSGGTWSPSIEEIASRYVDAEDKTGVYTSTYTVVSGDCSDSADISVIVIE